MNATVLTGANGRARLRIQLDSRQILSRPASPYPSEAPPRGEPKTIDIKLPGNEIHSFRYWKTKWTHKATRKVYRAYELRWTDAGHIRHREKRSSFAALRSRAEEIAKLKSNGETARQQLSLADQASYLRARELIASTGKPLEVIAGIYTECVQILNGADPVEACKFFVRNQPANAGDKTCPEIFKEMIPARRKDGASQNTLDDYESRLGKFTEAFTCPLIQVTARDINDWLRKLPVSRRTRNNYRGNLVDFYRFARECGYIPRTWNPLEEVKRVKNEPVTIEIWTPEEMVGLLAARVRMENGRRKRKTLIPFLVIGGFGGVRHEEMCASRGLPVLDWREVDFETEEIRVLPEVARKIGHDRILPMQPNLVAWLKQYRKNNGPICELANANNELQKTAAEAGLAWKDNGLRKSFISYRLSITKNIGTVASEAGTSPERIRHNYKKTVPEREGKRWFNLWPTSADIQQIPLPGMPHSVPKQSQKEIVDRKAH